MSERVDQSEYPRITFKCKCSNEFNVNVLRMLDKEQVLCQVCGQNFSVELGEKLAGSLKELYAVRYQLEKDGYPFHFAFAYDTSMPQSPSPGKFEQQ